MLILALSTNELAILSAFHQTAHSAKKQGRAFARPWKVACY
jgi:hypothetical protein